MSVRHFCFWITEKQPQILFGKQTTEQERLCDRSKNSPAFHTRATGKKSMLQSGRAAALQEYVGCSQYRLSVSIIFAEAASNLIYTVATDLLTHSLVGGVEPRDRWWIIWALARSTHAFVYTHSFVSHIHTCRCTYWGKIREGAQLYYLNKHAMFSGPASLE